MPELIDIVRGKLGRIWAEYYGIPDAAHDLIALGENSLMWSDKKIIRDRDGTFFSQQAPDYKLHRMADLFEEYPLTRITPYRRNAYYCTLWVSDAMDVVGQILHWVGPKAEVFFESPDAEFVAMVRAVCYGENPVALLDWLLERGIDVSAVMSHSPR